MHESNGERECETNTKPTSLEFDIYMIYRRILCENKPHHARHRQRWRVQHSFIYTYSYVRNGYLWCRSKTPSSSPSLHIIIYKCTQRAADWWHTYKSVFYNTYTHARTRIINATHHHHHHHNEMTKSHVYFTQLTRALAKIDKITEQRAGWILCA